MKKIKFKARPGQLFRSKFKLDVDLVANPNTHLYVFKDAVVMYLGSPDKQPGDSCNCSSCRSGFAHFLSEDKIIVLWAPERNLIPL